MNAVLPFKPKIKALCQEITERLETVHLRPLPGETDPVLMISDRYCGVWLEHVYDGVFYGEMDPAKGEIAKTPCACFFPIRKKTGSFPAIFGASKESLRWDIPIFRNVCPSGRCA